MGFNARILADSITLRGDRLTTFEVTFPRCILSEMNTHRVFSRNSSSSRAIPVTKIMNAVMNDPYIPTHWGKNQSGMQAFEELSYGEQQDALEEWLKARDSALRHATKFVDYGVHKQIVNRLLEPWMWLTSIISMTEWNNFFHLRVNPAANPEIQRIASMMRDVRDRSTPVTLTDGIWHMPLIQPGEFDNDKAFPSHRVQKVSVGRCARVSYLTHDGKRDPEADVELCDKLLKAGHMSPFEHIARPMFDCEVAIFRTQHDEVDVSPMCANYRGWVQYRKLIARENDILGGK